MQTLPEKRLVKLADNLAIAIDSEDMNRIRSAGRDLIATIDALGPQ